MAPPYIVLTEAIMKKLQSFVLIAALLSTRTVLAADAAEFARGNMNFDVKEMDANHDGMVSKDEFMQYGETMWSRMTQGGKDTLSVADAGRDFATGHMRFNAKLMDTDHDGTITKDEFMKYGEAMWDKMAKGAATMPIADAAKNFSRGNMHPAP
jgi:Ca2+-binding EF-hand superfamily protein